MSISTAILALAPKLYWHLDDPTAPAAADASGFGNPGAYGGNFGLNQQGPEVGSLAAIFYQTGFARTVGSTPVLAPPITMMAYVAPAVLTQNNCGICDNADTAFALRGFAWNFVTGGVGASAFAVIRPGKGTTALNGFLTDSKWHHLALTVDGAGNYNFYIDALLAANGAGMTNNPCVAGDKFQAGGANGDVFYMAHAALFNAVLTGAQIATIPAANTTPQAPSTLYTIAQADMTTLTTDLNAILASVRKVF